MKKILFAFVVLFLIAACGTPATSEAPVLIQPSPAPGGSVLAPEESVEPACVSIDPTQEDIDRALNFTGKLFETGDWVRTYTVTDFKVSVLWLSDSLYALAFLEAQIFECGYEDPDLNAYFNEGYWQEVFANYESHEMVTECRSDSGVRLYEFDTITDGVPYLVNYWVRNDTNTRVITFMMVVPEDSFDLLDEYGYSIFPQLSNCS